jgi:hypothetical protein
MDPDISKLIKASDKRSIYVNYNLFSKALA